MCHCPANHKCLHVRQDRQIPSACGIVAVVQRSTAPWLQPPGWSSIRSFSAVAAVPAILRAQKVVLCMRTQWGGPAVFDVLLRRHMLSVLSAWW